MKNTGTLQVTTPSDVEIEMRRVFNASRHLVFEALTNPELVPLWYGPHGHSLSACEIDFRVGGSFRYVNRMPDGTEMTQRGVYREIDAPARVVFSEWWDDFGGEETAAIVTSELTEADGRTTLVVTMRLPSKEIRDAVIASGMEHGAAETYDRLADYLASRG